MRGDFDALLSARPLAYVRASCAILPESILNVEIDEQILSEV